MTKNDEWCAKLSRMGRKAALMSLLAIAVPVFAACKINSVGDVGFGVYDVFSNLPNNNGVGSLAIKCTGSSTATVQIGKGSSTSFSPRILRNGANTLAYNVYTSSARNVVWGDGSGGTSVMSIDKNHAITLDIFGSIPEGQDAAVGMYTDTIIVTIDF